MMCFAQALPACKGSPDTPGLAEKQTLIWKDEQGVCIRILRRKNRPQGSGVLRRVCSCAGGQKTCVVHKLWETFLEPLPVGAEPWKSLQPGHVRSRLRRLLNILGVPDAAKYATQDFRRGHAEARQPIYKLGIAPRSHMFART